MTDFEKDMTRWHEIAAKSHKRHVETRSRGVYTNLLNLVEASGHREIARVNHKNKCVLEIGIGGGEHSHYEDKANSQRLYVGIDISIDFLRIANKLESVSAVNGDACRLPFPDTCFDSCIASGVLEHIPDLERALLEVKRVLRKEGDFLVVIPTNGSTAVGFFKMLITYPSLFLLGIRRPDLIWHFENVNHFKRIKCLLAKHFKVKRTKGLPVIFLPWLLSPLWFFHLRNR
jgi:SAM-dependent methyltransferase